MSINAPTTSASSINAANAASKVSSNAVSTDTKKSSSDTSFKEEMEKVTSSSEQKEDKNIVESKNSNDETVQNVENNKNQETQVSVSSNNEETNNSTQFGAIAVFDANSMLANDIALIANNNLYNGTENIYKASLNPISYDSQNSINMTENDAQFFINLTQDNNISMQNITVQAQNMLNQGFEAKEVKQNVQISQTLLDAINKARENNQPLRIDFDQNVSVILRISKEGVLAANFIPGDKAVEQYLKNNIESLKATFNENELPYSDLSYSSRGKQHQKENRRNRQQ